MDILIILIIMAILSYFGYLLLGLRTKQQLAFIEGYEFHPAIKGKLHAKYPHLTDTQLVQVFEGLRAYFYICNKAQGKMVSMPSQVVDVAWHEFILFTRAYQLFSKKALGRYLHHTPTEAMRTSTLAQEGIKRAWRLACEREGIDPKQPTRLPLLFALDGDLEIEDGFRYTLDCRNRAKQTGNDTNDRYCAGHIGCGGSSCGASCGSGCGGD